MIISELTASDITKLISLLSEEIAVMGVRIRMFPEKAEEINEVVKKNESIIAKLEKMF